MAKRRKPTIEGYLRDVARHLADVEHLARHNAAHHHVMNYLIFLRMDIWHLQTLLRDGGLKLRNIVRLPSQRFVNEAGALSSREMKQILAERRFLKSAMKKPIKPYIVN